MTPISYLGTVAIAADQSLERVVGFVSEVFDGFSLSEDDSGRFEEVPAFVATNGPIEINLCGAPEGEICDHFTLVLRCTDEIDPLAIGKKIGSDFIRSLPTNLPIESNGYANVSAYLSGLLSKSTALNCRALWISNQQSTEDRGNVG